MILSSREVERACKTHCARFGRRKIRTITKHNVRVNMVWTEHPTLSTIKIKQTKNNFNYGKQPKTNMQNLCIHTKGKREKEASIQNTERTQSKRKRYPNRTLLHSIEKLTENLNLLN